MREIGMQQVWVLFIKYVKFKNKNSSLNSLQISNYLYFLNNKYKILVYKKNIVLLHINVFMTLNIINFYLTSSFNK